MSELIDRIREQTEHAHDDAEGYFTAAEIRELLAEIDNAQARLATAWRDGYYTGKRDYGASFTCGRSVSTPNPYAGTAAARD